MSQPRTDLDVSATAVASYIDWLGGLDLVTTIYCFGSRSPKSKRDAREDSDWDFAAITRGTAKVTIPNPRRQGLHLDVLTIPSDKEELWLSYKPAAVEIWPTDKYGVLSNART